MADANELQDELSKLGIDSSAIDAASVGAQGNIPIPDPPQGASSWSSFDDWDDDDEPDYLAMRNMKDFYPKKGDALRLSVKNFDEEIFSGDQDFTLVNFYSKWCKKCQYQAPSFRAAARRYRDDPKVKVAVVNQEGNYDLSVRFDTDPAEPTIFFAHKNPQIDGDLKIYDGEVSFAGLLQFIGSNGTDMMKEEKVERPLYDPDDNMVFLGLNWSNYNETVFDPKKNVMVQYYAGWSEFCQIDANNYTVLAARMGMSNKEDVIIAAIDVDKHADLADRLDVQGLPAYWFANKSATKDTDLVRYTGDHNGALVIEELEPYINSGGMKVPEGMQHDWPIHPKPWEEIAKDMQERKNKEDEKDRKEREEQEKRAVERREKLAEKKKALKDKKEKKKRDEL